MKVSSKIYKGIEYVQLQELPKEQKEKFSESLKEDSLIKILVDEKIVSNCIQYREYELWFDTIYKKVVPSAPLKIDRVPAAATPVIAFEKV